MKRFVYMISDGTGITVEFLSNSLITQFETITFDSQVFPYIDTIAKANDLVLQINQSYAATGRKPLVFMTLVNPEVSGVFQKANARVFDLFNIFIAPLEEELGTQASDIVGRAHGVANTKAYNHRIEAINYALSHDDGIKNKGYDKADIILIGVSRSGKTPSCLYMALQFGVLAANYPFTDDNGLAKFKIPEELMPYKAKLFGLTIDPERLAHIRFERKPHSTYASRDQCKIEIAEIEEMYRNEHIPYINTTHYSIEEIATKIMAQAGITRRS